MNGGGPKTAVNQAASSVPARREQRKKFFKSPGSSAVVRGFCALALPVARLASIASPSAIPKPSMRASGRIAWPAVAVTSLKRLPPDDLSINPLVDWTIRYGGR